MNKRAFELSVNFIVIIIISLSIFVFGIKFIYDIYSNAQSLKDISIAAIDRQIIDLMCDSTGKICIGNDRVTLEHGDLEVITLRILNIDRKRPEADFKITVNKGIYLYPNNTAVQPGDYVNNIIVIPEEREETLKSNEVKSFGLGFRIPKKDVASGTYVFNINISKKTSGSFESYDKIQKIYIKVK